MGSAPDDTGDTRSDQPDYGPGGYLPPRAAQRARKIVLRERMGLQWPLAAGLAAVIVALGGGLFLLRGASPPAAPFVEVADLSALDAGAVTPVTAGDTEVLLVRAAGGIRAFLPPDGAAVAFCATSRRLESRERVWTVDGRLVGGDADAQSLTPVPTTVYNGRVFVDPTTRLQAAQPTPGTATPRCTPG